MTTLFILAVLMAMRLVEGRYLKKGGGIVVVTGEDEETGLSGGAITGIIFAAALVLSCLIGCFKMGREGQEGERRIAAIQKHNQEFEARTKDQPPARTRAQVAQTPQQIRAMELAKFKTLSKAQAPTKPVPSPNAVPPQAPMEDPDEEADEEAC